MPKISLRLMKGFKWELMQSFLTVFEPDPKIEIFFEKRGAAGESNVDFEIGKINRLRKVSCRVCDFLFGH